MNIINNSNYKHLMTLALIIVMASCSNGTKKTDAGETVEEVKDEALQTKNDLKAEYNEAIKGVDKKIDGLEDKLESTTDDVRQDLTATLDELKKERKKLVDKLAEISAASEENWKDLKNDSKAALVTLKAKIDSLSIKAEELFN